MHAEFKLRRADALCATACLLVLFLLFCQDLAPANGLKAQGLVSRDGLQKSSRTKMRRRGGRRGQDQRRHYREWKAESVGNEGAQLRCGPSQTQQVIRDYHLLQKKNAQATIKGDVDKSKTIQEEILAATATYQTACTAQSSTAGPVVEERMRFKRYRAGKKSTMWNSTAPKFKPFNSTEWILQELALFNLSGQHAGGSGGSKVKLLDVGSITNGWHHKLIDATCIDPHPNPLHAPTVIPFDMLEYFRRWRVCHEVGEEQAGVDKTTDGDASTGSAASGSLFDCVALSMVLNCEGDAKRRGRMLAAARDMLRPGGLILVSLPRACLDNSRFCSQRIFLGQMRRLGLKALRVVRTCRLFLLVLQHKKTGQGDHETVARKRSEQGLRRRQVSGIGAHPPDEVPEAPSPGTARQPQQVSPSRRQRSLVTNVKRPLRTGAGRNNFRIDF